MMKTRLLPSLGLLVLLLAACAPAAVSPEPSGEQPAAPVAAEPTPTPFTPADPAPADPVTEPVAAPTEEVAAAEPLPVATSRGDNLHATTPSEVSLASGGLQFVEFFRFT
jgi:nucleoid-associated protein YgaU